jgi:RNA polymerase sigma-70 factor (ECF subfamily)
MSKAKQQEFLDLYEPIHDRFERFCKARVYGNMEFQDLVNETLLVAFDKFETLKSKKAFLGFLFGISIRILSNNNRKKKENYLQSEDKSHAIEDNSAKTEMDAEIHFLYKALGQLKETQRESIILFEISGFSIKEIAKLQDTTISAVKLRLKRGRKNLMEIMTFESTFKRGEIYSD